MEQKYQKLLACLSGYGRIAVAYSAGVDSTFLLYAAAQAAPNNVIAITASSPFFPKQEMKQAVEFCKQQQIEHIVLPIDPLNDQNIRKNDEKRCYYCKKTVMREIQKQAQERGFFVVVEGSNTDDENDYRPGQKAIEELRIQSPLKQNGWSKQQIREMSQKLGLDTAQKPAFACLATRIPHGTPITKDALSAIERAEQCLFSLGFRQVRVRHHGEVARIEVEPEQMPLVLTHKKDILDGVRQAGFRFVTMDLFGYRMGNMNGVSPDEKQNETA